MYDHIIHLRFNYWILITKNNRRHIRLLDKTKVMFKEDIREMYIYYNKFNRLKAHMIEYFRKFILIEYVDKIGYNNGIFRFEIIEDNDETHMERFNTLVEDLRSQGFDPAYCPDETVFYISFENIAEIILKEYP